jgi:hypothetical protein
VKKERRKPPRKPPRKPERDRDLLELANVIAEHKLEQNARGWFTLPWRSGWNAVRLGIAWWKRISGDLAWSLQSNEPLVAFMDYVHRSSSAPPGYEIAEDLRAAARRVGGAMHNSNRQAPLMAAARCYQIMLARSDGGGQTYNEVLLAAHEACAYELIPFELGADDVRNARRDDALGISRTSSRHKKAFEIAWERGLFHAAYAINPK